MLAPIALLSGPQAAGSLHLDVQVPRRPLRQVPRPERAHDGRAEAERQPLEGIPVRTRHTDVTAPNVSLHSLFSVNVSRTSFRIACSSCNPLIKHMYMTVYSLQPHKPTPSVSHSPYFPETPDSTQPVGPSCPSRRFSIRSRTCRYSRSSLRNSSRRPRDTKSPSPSSTT